MDSLPSLTRRSALGLARAIRAREVSSRQVVEAHIEEIRRHNPRINALVADRFGEALAEADAAGAALAGGEDPRPFLGVPCTIKEAFALTGMPNSSGLVARAGLRATADATAVKRLRAAGFIPLGVTNISELCMWMESDNRIYGRTNNPYDARCIAGGSSGGEGAIIGAGASPVGLGSDVGGSIRMPAFFCGVFGHKPTGGMVPGSGQFPVAENAALRYVTTGPLARRAEDLYPFLRIVAGPDGQDQGCLPFDLGDPAGVSIDGLDVVSVADNGVTPVSGELRRGQRRAADHLAEQGAKVRHVEVAGLRRSLEIWSTLMEEAADTPFRVWLGEGQPIGVAAELARLLLGRSPHTLAALGLAAFEQLPLFGQARVAQVVERGRALQRELEDLIGDGVMLYPPYATVAPRHRVPLVTPLRFVYTAIVNVLELPSTQVPLGLAASGLPLGVQVIGTRGSDHRTIAVAQALEAGFGGWVPPRSAL